MNFHALLCGHSPPTTSSSQRLVEGSCVVLSSFASQVESSGPNIDILTPIFESISSLKVIYLTFEFDYIHFHISLTYLNLFCHLLEHLDHAVENLPLVYFLLIVSKFLQYYSQSYCCCIFQIFKIVIFNYAIFSNYALLH